MQPHEKYSPMRSPCSNELHSSLGNSKQFAHVKQEPSGRTQFEMGENYVRTICTMRLYSAGVTCRPSGKISVSASER